ncbi:MAG TPA: hypothetical protein VEM37_06580 [Nitrospiraceae bacterium]|nr:hypothetical protein [Nitrospiraceae bacterium]
MSHVSERALRNIESVDQLGLEFSDEVGIEGTSLSEVTAYFMVGSPFFAQLIKSAEELTAEHVLPQNPTKFIQKAIIGQPISDEIPLLHELISGPFDADKLDYMPRDAHMAGVPVVTDINRLIEKVRAVRVTQDELPPEVQRVVRAGLTTYTMTGIVLSGGRTLDELMLGRILLFDKIYRHQKVRAAESMVSSIILLTANIIAPIPAYAPYRWNDDELLDMSVDRVEHMIQRSLTDTEKKNIVVAVDIARRLRERRIFVRAFAFAQNMPLDPKLDKEHVLGLERLQRDARNSEQRGKLVENIVNEVKAILVLLNKEDILGEFPQDSLNAYVWLDPPDHPPQGGNVTRAYLIAHERKILRFNDDSAETRGWTDAYLLTRDIGYIFSPDTLAPFVFIAAEKVIRHEYNIRIPASMLSYAKQQGDEIDSLRKDLDSAGYYNQSPFDLKPMPERLGRADISRRLDQVVNNLSGYSGIDPEGKLKFNTSRLRDWVRQFESESLVDGALRIAEKLKLIGRTEIVESLRSFIRSNTEFEGAFVCQLGTPKDSSAIATYYAQDIAKYHRLKVISLNEALEAPPTIPILFLDDFIGQGSTAVTAIESMLGVPASVDLRQSKGKPLDAALQDALRARPLAFIFAAGNINGKETLEQRAKALGLTVKVNLHLTEDKLPHAFTPGVFSSPEQETSFKEKCEEVAKDLHNDGDPKHDSAWAETKLLGYGNSGLLVAFPYNTPSQTLTCIWKSGQYHGRPWMPLLLRRKKE